MLRTIELDSLEWSTETTSLTQVVTGKTTHYVHVRYGFYTGFLYSKTLVHRTIY